MATRHIIMSVVLLGLRPIRRLLPSTEVLRNAVSSFRKSTVNVCSKQGENGIGKFCAEPANVKMSRMKFGVTKRADSNGDDDLRRHWSMLGHWKRRHRHPPKKIQDLMNFIIRFVFIFRLCTKYLIQTIHFVPSARTPPLVRFGWFGWLERPSPP